MSSLDQPVFAAALASNLSDSSLAEPIRSYLHAQDYRVFTGTQQTGTGLQSEVTAATLATELTIELGRSDLKTAIQTFCGSHKVYSMTPPPASQGDIDPCIIPQVAETDKKRVCKRKIDQCDMIYNTTTQQFEHLLDATWTPLIGSTFSGVNVNLTGKVKAAGQDRLVKKKEAKTQSLSANISAAIQTWDSADVTNVGTFTVASNGRVTVGTSGHYLVNIVATFVQSLTGVRDLWIRVDGSIEYGRISAGPSTNQTIPIRMQTSVQLDVTAGSYIEFMTSSTVATTLSSAQMFITCLFGI
jgi:hypothetical protein